MVMLRVTALLVFLTGYQTSEALQCYECGSHHVMVECSQCERAVCSPSSQCSTVVDKMIPQVPRIEIKCSDNCVPVDTSVKLTTCCTSDLCNYEQTGCPSNTTASTSPVHSNMTTSAMPSSSTTSAMPSSSTTSAMPSSSTTSVVGSTEVISTTATANGSHETLCFLLVLCLVGICIF